jgi:hypothetical protein
MKKKAGVIAVGIVLTALILNGCGKKHAEETSPPSETNPPPSDTNPPPSSDTTPPSPPSNLTASATETSILLTWTASSSGDVDHYNIYRDTKSISQLGTPIAASTTASYTDNSVSKKTHYFYKITAVDRAGNESSPSNEARAIVCPDEDQDGYLDKACWTSDCSNCLDCDDSDKNINPNVEEVKDNKDNNCDSKVDETPTGADNYEWDNNANHDFSDAKLISIDGTPQQRNFHSESDEDWIKFTVEQTGNYVIKTFELGTNADTDIYLYDSGGEPTCKR